MKRVGSLFDDIAAWDNLRLAWYNASRGKRSKASVLLYRTNLEWELSRLHETLTNGDYRGIGRYRFFTIYEPKERLICAAPFSDRVLHHAIINILEPYFESFQIFDSYACRQGKGTDAALKRALHFARRYNYFVKLDARRYFDTIDHDILKRLLRRRFKDRKVLSVLCAIIDTYHTQPGKGVPIGNLTSQYFANHYLAVLDHYAKERLRVPAWIRYMDDMLLFDNYRERVQEAAVAVDSFCGRNLELALKPLVVGPVAKGVPFLGFLIKPKGIYLSRKKHRRSARRFVEYARRFHTGEWNDSELVDHLLPVCAHLSIARSRCFRNNILERTGLRPESRPSRR